MVPTALLPESLRKLTFLLLVVVAGCSGGGNPNPPTAPTSTPIPTAPAIAKPTYVVQRGDVQDILEFSGRWQPRDQMSLAFEVGGTARRVNVKRGDSVKAGDLIADLQIDTLESQLASAQLDLESALANLSSGESGSLDDVSSAEINFANARLSLANAKAGSPWTGLETARSGVQSAQQHLADAQRAYDDIRSRPDQSASAIDSAYAAVRDAEMNLKNAQTSYAAAQQTFSTYQFGIAQDENAVIAAEKALEQARSGATNSSGQQAVRSAQLSVDQINAQIKAASLYAPIDGEILEVTLKPGDAVDAYKVVITIGQPEPKEAIAALSFNDAQKLSVGLVGICQVVNRPETAVQCIVRRLPLTAQDADQTTRVAASLDNVASGQLIQIDMPMQVRSNVLWLPPAAIRTFQNRTFVVVQTLDGQRAVDVQIGLQTDERVEIVSGVQEGEVVVGP